MTFALSSNDVLNDFQRWTLAGNRLGHFLDKPNRSDDANHEMKTKENDRQLLQKKLKKCLNGFLFATTNFQAKLL